MSDEKLRHTRKMIGKRVVILGNPPVFGLVESVKDWQTVVVDAGIDGKVEAEIYDIRDAE